MLSVLVRWLLLLALALWLGEIVFFSFVVAPSVFKVLPVSDAGRVVAAIFPRYYALGVSCGVVCAATVAILWLRHGGAVWAVTGALVAVMLAATIYAAAVIHPRASALREQLHASPTEIDSNPLKAEFDRLHRRSVQVNAVVLVLALVALGTTAGALRP